MTTAGLCLYWLKGRSLWVRVHVWFCLCKYLMYPSGAEESKYPLERGVEWRRRFTTGQEAVITTAEALYTHTVQTGTREEKYKPQTREQEGSRHYIPTAPHLPKPGPSCVWSSQLLHHLEPWLIYSLLRLSPIKTMYKYGNLARVTLTLDRGSL